ncbi:MAG: hypothetical protein MJ177_00460 [Clostridia bacterium]|nr:hypothetical protein [Clostridia bacterium]
MANCPSCGRKLHLKDWRPVCPGCGANLNYFDSNKNLLEESEKAEIEHARFQPKVDRAKAAYAGSKLAILRIVFSLLPVGALFLPLCTMNGEKMNVLAVYGKINEAGIDKVLLGAFSSPLKLSASLLLLSAVLIIVSLVLIIMSLGKHGKIRVIITYLLIPLLSAGSIAAFMFSGSGNTAGVGAYLYTALLLFLFAWNIILLKKGIPVKHTACLIGGLPSEEYFGYVEQGMSKSEIRRKMLVALSALEKECEKEETEE